MFNGYAGSGLETTFTPYPPSSRVGSAKTSPTALRRYLGTRGAEPATLLEYARALDIFGPARTAVDVASAG